MKFIKIFFSLMIVFIISGCSTGNTTEKNIYEKINKKFINISDYTATGTLTVISNKTQNKYEFVQYYKTENKYVMEFNDVSYVINGANTLLKNKKTKQNINLNNNQNELYLYFINSFFKQYFTSETASIQVSNNLIKKVIVLECEMEHKHLNKEKLWIDTKTLLPVKIEFYDINDIMVTRIEFENFKFEKNISDEIFNF